MSATVLVVEDEPSIQELIAASLQRAGHRVLRADTAEDAGRLVGETLPDVVLLDWMLPGMSGIQYARRLRSEERTQDLARANLVLHKLSRTDDLTGISNRRDIIEKIRYWQYL